MVIGFVYRRYGVRALKTEEEKNGFFFFCDRTRRRFELNVIYFSRRKQNARRFHLACHSNIIAGTPPKRTRFFSPLTMEIGSEALDKTEYIFI